MRRKSDRPLAVAVSGGGDSLALLLAVADWGRSAGRRLLVLNVDHGLRPESAAWAQACAVRADALGQEFRGLQWLGDKPTTGLPAAARAARHRLLADAARSAGAGVILMGHTADDVLEAQVMRADGATTPSPRQWAPSPVWPKGRGIFLLRPMLGLRRAAIRDWLTARGERWIDDPANDDLTYARVRARRSLAPGEPAGQAASLTPIAELARGCAGNAAGVLALPREVLRRASSAAAARFISVACLCAAGTERPPAMLRTQRLAERIRGSDVFAATLAGARVETDAEEVRFLREAGEMARGGLSPAWLADGAGVWDGRFEIEAGRPVQVVALAGRIAALPQVERRALAGVTPRARPTLPVVLNEGGVAVPAVREALALARLRAASGLVEVEPA